MSLKQEAQTIRQLLDATPDEAFEKYLKIRMLKVRIARSKDVALKHGGNIIQCKLTGEDLELYNKINLNALPLEDYNNLMNEGETE